MGRSEGKFSFIVQSRGKYLISASQWTGYPRSLGKRVTRCRVGRNSRIRRIGGWFPVRDGAAKFPGKADGHGKRVHISVSPAEFNRKSLGIESSINSSRDRILGAVSPLCFTGKYEDGDVRKRLIFELLT